MCFLGGPARPCDLFSRVYPKKNNIRVTTTVPQKKQSQLRGPQEESGLNLFLRVHLCQTTGVNSGHFTRREAAEGMPRPRSPRVNIFQSPGEKLDLLLEVLHQAAGDAQALSDGHGLGALLTRALGLQAQEALRSLSR